METDSRTVPGMKCEQCWGTPGGEGHCRWPRKVRSPPEQGGSASRQEGALLWRGDLLPPFRSGPACRLRGWPCLQDILPTLQPLHGTYSAGDKQSHSEPPLRKPDRGATGHQAQPPPSAFGGEGSGPAPTPSRRRKEVVPSSHPFPLASLGPDSRDSRLAPTGGTFVHLQERRRPRHARAYGAGGGGGRGRAGDQQGDRRARARAPARGGAGWRRRISGQATCLGSPGRSRQSQNLHPDPERTGKWLPGMKSFWWLLASFGTLGL
ncbi:voltage-gated hydrogen channel 1 isoform X7 [Mustela putorius furo]|uniref:Voltage-gated hydrogen channel 1 isoform X7 n=1 Tax=Mustela putorius furo TaxID=9669 RepID=A0A8U0UX61_MUSPF|nr:voltage-gated hydrogen channel 1 isoform X7 [Mustela putorius furo]